jgi:hypothetical protein
MPFLVISNVLETSEMGVGSLLLFSLLGLIAQMTLEGANLSSHWPVNQQIVLARELHYTLRGF